VEDLEDFKYLGISLTSQNSNQDEINLLEPEFYIEILTHPVGKMRIIQEPNKVAL